MLFTKRRRVLFQKVYSVFMISSLLFSSIPFGVNAQAGNGAGGSGGGGVGSGQGAEEGSGDENSPTPVPCGDIKPEGIEYDSDLFTAPINWSHSNLCAPGSACGYKEGDVVPSRVVMSNLEENVRYTFSIEYGYERGGVIGYDSLTRETSGFGGFTDSGVSGVVFSGHEAPEGCSNGSNSGSNQNNGSGSMTCIVYDVTFTADSSVAEIYWGLHLSNESAGWPGSSLHFGLADKCKQSVSINLDDSTPDVDEDLGSLLLKKVVDNGDASSDDWCFTVSPEIEDQTEFCIGDNEDSILIEDVPFGEYTVTEHGAAGADISGYVFASGDGNNCTFVDGKATAAVSEAAETLVTASVSNDNGTSVPTATCTFHNTLYQAPETCGDGVRDAGEECDYGKNLNGDSACSSDCRFVSSQPVCEDHTDVDLLDEIDLGDAESESEHGADGWGEDPGGGDYGDRDNGGNIALVVGKNECTEESGVSASFTLDAGSGDTYADKLTIRHLDGKSNNDSFDVFVDEKFLARYTDSQDSDERWVTSDFPLNNLQGDIEVKLVLTDPIWDQCTNWGQLAVNWAKISGYECPEDVCEVGPAWAHGFVSSSQGLQKDNGAVDENRSFPENALGEQNSSDQEMNFYSLGFGGEIVLEFIGWAKDIEGPDLSFHETTWERFSYGEEKADVYVSQDGVSWKPIGEASNHATGGSDGVTELDFDSTGFQWVKYVKLVDTTDPDLFEGDADGYDIDAVDVKDQLCEEPSYCVEGSTWAYDVRSYTEGSGVVDERSDPANALGEPDSTQQVVNFVSLGRGGEIVLEFAGWILDEDGDDLSIHEITWGDRSVYAEETAEVWVSQDNVNWVQVGIATSRATYGVTLLDISGSGYPWIRYVKLVDTTSAATDGFDLDAVDAVTQVCEEPIFSDVTICKVDENQNSLPGWNVQLLGEKVDTIEVDPDGGSYLSSDLPAGDYVLVAHGTYLYRGGSTLSSDPNYSERLSTEAAWTGEFLPWVNVKNLSHPGYLGIMVGGVPTNWSDYFNSEHIYALGYENHSGEFGFTIKDACTAGGLEGCYGDNRGSLFVDIYEGYAGTTGEDGCVTFADVPSGEYELAETLRVGWKNDTGLDAVTVDEKEEMFMIQNHKEMGDIRACTYEDSDANGVRDDGEEYIDWNIMLEEQDSEPYQISYQDEAGCYIWEDLDLGTYTVSEDTSDTGWIPTTDSEFEVTVSDGSMETVEFGNFHKGRVGGLKFVDYNGDGLKNGMDHGMGGWTMVLGNPTKIKDMNIQASNNVPVTIGTGTSGEYYVLRVTGTASAGDGITFDAECSTRNASPWDTYVSNYESYGEGLLDLEINGEATDWGLCDPDHVYTKVLVGDGNQVTLGINDIYYPNNSDFLRVEVFRMDNAQTDVTDSAGGYSFDGLGHKEYALCEVQQEGWAQTAPSDYETGGCYWFTPVSGFSDTYDFGNFKYGMIQGLKYKDVNGNGDYDQWESSSSGRPYSIDGWQIHLYNKAWAEIETMNTGDDSTDAGKVNKGQYRFDNLRPGTYYVCEEDRDGWMQTEPSDTSGVLHDGMYCYKVTIKRSGAGKTGLQFGNFELGQIEGVKFNDENGNHRRDMIAEVPSGLSDSGDRSMGGSLLLQENSEEPLLNGWTIKLYGLTDESWEFLDEVKTGTDGKNGHYMFDGLEPGTYFVCEGMQEGWNQTLPSLTTTDGIQPEVFSFNEVSFDEGGMSVVQNESGVDQEGSVCWAVVIGGFQSDYAGLDFGNNESSELGINKTNDHIGEELSAGDSVEYTITVTALTNDVRNVVVYDLPPAGFIVRETTRTLSGVTELADMGGSEYLDGSYAENGYGQWYLGDMTAGETKTLTYIADISEDTQPGTYPDSAWAKGTSETDEDVFAYENSETPDKDDLFAGTEVTVIAQAEEPPGVVLGTSTVLAQTGGNILVYVLGALGFLGLAVWGLGVFSRKFSMLLIVMASGIAMIMIGITVPVYAGNLDVTIQQPATPMHDSEFRISFGAVDILGRDLEVSCQMKGPSDTVFGEYDSAWKAANGQAFNGYCNVVEGDLNEDGVYEFQTVVTAGANEESKISRIVSVDYDVTPPGKIVDYSKEETGTCAYTLTFTTASDGETTAIEIYRSSQEEFIAGPSTFVAAVVADPGKTYTYTDALSSCAEPLYYVVRAVDDSENKSEFTGDTIVTMEYAVTPEGEQIIVPAGAVAGEQAGPAGEGAAGEGAEGEDGEVLGEEEEKDADEDGIPDVEDEDADGNGMADNEEDEDGDAKNITRWVLAVGGIIAIGAVGYLVYRYIFSPRQ